MAKCLRCGAGPEWLEGTPPPPEPLPADAPTVLHAAEDYLAELAADRVPRRELPNALQWGLIQTLATALREKLK